MKRIFHIIILLLVFCVASFAQEDILDFAAKHSRNSKVQNPDGTWRTPKYGDYKLEKAVEELQKHKRPWTVSRVLKWYGKAKDAKLRANLLRVLAASKDSRAAIALGNALEDKSLDVRLSAVYGLTDYFVEIDYCCGTEQAFFVAKEWWEKNKKRLDEKTKERKLKKNEKTKIGK